ncbi:cytochrome b5 [Aspergillus terreus]|nr:cytochrome b5 [Aspergillus terreus]
MATFTLEQVQKHNTANDLWIVLHNKVYNVTKYLDDHPGGTEVLVEVAGTDATEAFEGVGHSDEAREQLEPYYVGDLPSEEQTETVEIYRPNFEQVSQSAAVNVKKASPRGSLLRTAVKLGLGGLLGTAIATAYRRGLTPSQVLQLARSTLSSSPLPRGPGGSDGASFWSGVGIASVAQFSATIGLGFWVSTKLDVQQEFTHYAPRRHASPARLIRLRKTYTLTTPRRAPLDPRQWRPFTLAHKTEIAPHVYHLVFALPHADDTLGLPTGQHIALRATINGTAVTRSYTPISNNSDRGRIELLVKVYPSGTMTQHLAQMKPGSTIDVRGPKGAMQYSRRYAKCIGMIAGGTGITPMYQLIRAICEDPADADTRVALLYANNAEDDILLRAELDAFARDYPERFEVRYVLSRPGENWTGYRGFVDKGLIAEHMPMPAEEHRMLLCGPPPMVDAMKKVLGGMGWAMPGAVAKAGDQVFCF